MFVKMSETYDLSTKIGKLAMVTVHTPRGNLCQRLWGGLLSQYKQMRWAKCDVSLACASMLPVDPAGIGFEAGDVAPQDMFNPILYTAVSNDSYSTLMGYITKIACIQSTGTANTDPALQKNSVTDVNDALFYNTGNSATAPDQEKIYYALLSDPDAFAKAMPQAGLRMRGLVPMTYLLSANFGIQPNSSDGNANIGNQVQFPSNIGSSSNVAPSFIKGPSMTMPFFNTKVYSSTVTSHIALGPTSVNNINSGLVTSGAFHSIADPEVAGSTSYQVYPVVPVAAIILPPAKQNVLYYRLKVTWTIEFRGLESLLSVNNWNGLATIGDISYGSDYEQASANVASVASSTAKTDLVDTADADITKIMEGAS
nr:MAG: capsid protein [Smacoviridae sp.]